MRKFSFLAPLALILLLGLGLRIACARGGLWVDEAWSALHARDAGNLAGVLFRIDHDNNHHLNSMWMQVAGVSASPVLIRALAIAAGTGTILVAALIGARSSPLRGLILATLFAVSPMMVNYGSEARGYAPMTLAALAALFLVDRALRQDGAPNGYDRVWLAAIALLGTASQMTMVFFLLCLAGWFHLSRTFKGPARGAFQETVRLFSPAAAASGAFIGLVIVSAAMNPKGMSVGSYEPFTPAALTQGILGMVGGTFGLSSCPLSLAAAILIGLVLVAAARLRHDHYGPFYVLAIVAFPIGLGLLQVGNTGFARYYLVSSVALLMLTGALLATGLEKRGWWRTASAFGLVATVAASLWQVGNEVGLRRGDTDAAVEAMKNAVPRGTTILLQDPREQATLEVSAQRRGYRLSILTHCGSARYYRTDYPDGRRPPAQVARCGQHYSRVLTRPRGTFSGENWALYALKTGRAAPASEAATH